MDTVLILKVLTLLIGLYMAWNIGANDVSNAMGTSVGSGALTLRRAVIIAAIFEFSGAFFLGGEVSETMQRGIVDASLFQDKPMVLTLGMLASLLGTGIWLQLASYFRLPVSTTHAIVGAIIGFGVLIGGVETVKWGEIGSIASSWVISPLLSGLLSYILFVTLQRKILFAMNPREVTLKYFPYIVGVVFTIFTLSLIFNGLKHLHLPLTFPFALLLSSIVGAISALIANLLLRGMKLPSQSSIKYSPQHVIALQKAVQHLQRVKSSSQGALHEEVSSLLSNAKKLSEEIKEQVYFTENTSEYNFVEKMFVFLQILSACFVAFAHGANDVANAIGPMAAVFDLINSGSLSDKIAMPTWLLALGGGGIVLGLATWGWRVIETIGKKITELTPTRGFCAEFGAATTILLASKCGLPISTTHCLVGAVMGIGIAGGIRAINLSTLRDIVLSWIITLPASAIMSVIAYFILKTLFI